MSLAVETIAARPAGRSWRWVVVGGLAVGMAIANIDRVNLSVLLALDGFKREFGLSDASRGAVNSAFFWAYALMQVPAGWLVDRHGVKVPYAIGFVFFCVVSAATGLASSLWQIVLLRVLLGVGESVVQPASQRWISRHFDESRRGLAIGLYMAGLKVGPAVGAVLAAWLVAGAGWRAMFALLGLAGLVWPALWMLLVNDDDRGSHAARGHSRAAAPVDFGRVLRSRAMWGILLGTVAYNYFYYFCLTWLPAYFVEQRGLSLKSMGVYTMASFLGLGAVQAGAGWLSDRMVAAGRPAARVRKGFIIAGLLLASTELIGALSSSRSVALFFAVFSLAGLGLASANKWALTQTLMPGGAIGRIVGLQNAAANLAGVMAALFTGWLKEASGGYVAPMVAILGVLLLGVASYVFLVRPEHAPRPIVRET